jgi:hypothetical protein
MNNNHSVKTIDVKQSHPYYFLNSLKNDIGDIFNKEKLIESGKIAIKSGATLLS